MNTTGAKSEAAKQLGALKIVNERLWREKIAGAMTRAEGHVRDFQGAPGAASILGVAAPTLFEWLRKDPQLARIPRLGSEVGRPAVEKPLENKGRKKKSRG